MNGKELEGNIDTNKDLESSIDRMIGLYKESSHDLRTFMDSVVNYIGSHPQLIINGNHIVHSYKSRLKNPDHLKEKIIRKSSGGDPITEENIFSRITDLAGVRILHIFQDDFRYIDSIIRRKVEKEGDWCFGERPRAYSWDPETVVFFRQFDLDVLEKSTSYTSVHYLVKPRPDSKYTCEIQVRTLFEEIWGEVDHKINYPAPTDSIALREQIKVLSKIVGAGSRLLDSLRRVENS